MKKLDLIGIPLQGLGMENFGLLTFRTDHFLINQETLETRKRRICLLILHETSHLWFGDLVTVRWWKYLYLKEGFARFLEYTVACILYPQIDWWDHFLSSNYPMARYLDSSQLKLHPIEVPIDRARDVENIFDTISYAKASNVIRMACDFVGQEKFFFSLSQLISSHAYDSIVTEDLWSCLNTYANLESSFMNVWVKFPGHPTLNLTRVSTDSSTLVFRITQQSLSRTKSPIKNHPVDSQLDVFYPLPFLNIMLIDSLGNQSFLKTKMMSNSILINFNQVAGDLEKVIVKLNWNQSSFVSSNYPNEMWELFIQAILDKKFPKSDIHGLLTDSIENCLCDNLDFTICDRLIKACSVYDDDDNINFHLTNNIPFSSLRKKST